MARHTNKSPDAKSRSAILRNREKRKYDSKKLLTRLNERFPNFLLGLTVVALVILIGSMFFQNKEISSLNFPQSINKLFGGKTDLPDQTVTRSYTVKKGDSLWSIAEEAYGSGYNAYDLAELNNISDANVLNEGVVLKLPALEPKDPTRGEIAGGGYTTKAETPQALQNEILKPGQTHKIIEGESLWSIALKLYGNPYKWVELQAANPKITNPNLIYAGDTLNLL